MVRRTNRGRETILTQRRIGHVNHTESVLHRELRRITGTGNRRRIRLRRKHLVTGKNRQRVVVTQTLNLIVQRRSPTNTIAAALAELGRAVTILQTGIPILRLRPVAAQRQLGLGRHTLEGLPRQTRSGADALVEAIGRVVIDDIHRIVHILHVRRTHTQVGSNTRTQRVVNRTETESGRSRTVLRTVVAYIRVTEVGIEGQGLGQLLHQLHVSTPTAIARLNTNTLTIGVVHSCIVLRLVVTTAERQVMVPSRSRLHDIVGIVVNGHVLVLIEVVAILRTQTIVGSHVVGVGLTISRSIAPGRINHVVGVHTILYIGQRAQLIVHVVVHLQTLVLLTTLGRDKDNTVSTARTIDSRRSSILQYVHRLDVVGRDIRDIAHLDTIHDEERLVRLRNRTATTHANRHRTARTTVLRGYLHTGELALKCLGDVRYGVGSELLTRYRGHRTGQITTLHRTVTNHHDILDTRGILLKDHLNRGLAGNGYALLGHTDVRYNQHVVLCVRYIQRERTVHTRTCTQSCAFHNHGCTDYRLACCVFHDSSHSLCLSREGEAPSQHYGQDKLERKVFHCKSF